MSHRSCAQETAVARAVRTGTWNEALQAHVRDCATCRSVQEAARWMQGVASQASAQAEHDLPDPQILWLRAQLSERQAAAERVRKIAQQVEIACVAAVCAGLGIWLAWSWNEIGGDIAGGLGWALFDAWPALWSSVYAYGPVNAPILFFSATITISLLVIGVSYPLVARE
jgi:DNA-binding transcriptional LysR family regulator